MMERQAHLARLKVLQISEELGYVATVSKRQDLTKYCIVGAVD